MKIDKTIVRYNRPNVFVNVKTEIKDAQLVPWSPMAQVVTTLAAKKGGFKFVYQASHRVYIDSKSVTCLALDEVKIYHEDELLVIMSRDGMTRNYRYVEAIGIKGKRLQMTTRRITKTTDPKRAVTIVSKLLKPSTNAEVMRGITRRVKFPVQDLHDSLQSKWKHRLTSLVVDKIQAEFISNIEAISKCMNLTKEQAESFKAVEDTYEDYKIVHNVNSVLEAKQGLIIKYQKDNTVTAHRPDNQELKVIKVEELPSDIRTKLGMLKLVEDNTAVINVGYRTDSNLFFIVE